MIILFNPQAAKRKNRRLPLSVLALGAVLEGKHEYVIVDGNVEADPTARILALLDSHRDAVLGVTVMPGPQTKAALPACKAVKARFPKVPIVWGGYFPSIYPDACLNAEYVDYVVRGQGEDTLVELLAALQSGSSLDAIRGLSFRRGDGAHQHNPERLMKGPDAFPRLPYHRVNAADYMIPTFFGRRTAVHQASIGCPFQCSFCGVIAAFGSREKFETPARTEQILRHLQTSYGADSVQFYDMNFFLREDQARELMDRIAPLGMRWWCEARIDVLMRFSDAAWEAMRRAGCAMIFSGAESGSDWVLQQMKKGLTTAETMAFVERMKRFGIIPELSFVIGNPHDPERDVHECLQFIRRVKIVNPDSEIILYHYTPVPQRSDEMYGDVEFEFPATPDEWATDKWQNFVKRIDPNTPWMARHTKDLIDNFELVLASRWPSVQDYRLSGPLRRVLKVLGSWRYEFQIYSHPAELRWAQKLIDLRKPKFESV